jgi:hypothetical protein
MVNKRILFSSKSSNKMTRTDERWGFLFAIWQKLGDVSSICLLFSSNFLTRKKNEKNLTMHFICGTDPRAGDRKERNDKKN